MQAPVQLVGGPCEEKTANKEVQDIINSVKSQVEGKTGKKYQTFKAKSYKTQVVAGTNYFVKVHVGGENYIHVRVFKGLPHTSGALEVHGCQESKGLRDPINCF